MIFGLRTANFGIIFCAISFQDFQPMWSLSTNVTDGQTYVRTNRHTCASKTSLCIVVHNVIKTCFYIQSYIPRTHEIQKQYTDKMVPVLPSSENMSTAPILYTQCLPEKYSFSCISGGALPFVSYAYGGNTCSPD